MAFCFCLLFHQNCLQEASAYFRLLSHVSPPIASSFLSHANFSVGLFLFVYNDRFERYEFILNASNKWL